MKLSDRFMLLLVIMLLPVLVIAQNAEPAGADISQLKIMVIPRAKAGQDLRTILGTNFNLREAIGKIKDGLDKMGFITQDFENTLTGARQAQLFKTTAQADVKSAFIKFSGVDLYVEMDVNIATSSGGTKAKILLNAFDAVTADLYATITCDSREKYGVENGALINIALAQPIPPPIGTDDDDRRSKLPCLEDFMNNLKAKLTKDVIERIVGRRKAKTISTFQQNCSQVIAKANSEVAARHYEAARDILLTVPAETGQCYDEAQQKVAETYKQQYGSTEKAADYYQKKLIIYPESDEFKKNLDIINKFIEARSKHDTTPPTIVLQTPTVTRGQEAEAEITSKGEIYVSGFAKDDSGIGSVTVNGKTVTNIQPGGFFSIYIKKGTSELKIDAADKKGNIVSAVYHLALRNEAKAPSVDEIVPISDDEKYHAIFIGNGNYTGKLVSLPVVEEERKLIKLFVSKYNFKYGDIDTLFNKTRREILNLLMDKLPKLTENDNLVIYYGGHGDYLDNMAYWIPIDATDETTYISNTQITALLEGCKAHHILIMSDACFSGGMRGGVDAPSRYEYKINSRQLLASGGIEKVPGTSVYVKELLKYLSINDEKYVSVRDLQARIYPGIKNDAQTECSLITLKVSDSEGGQFYFKKQ